VEEEEYNSDKKFLKTIKRCSRGNRKAQEHLYSVFYRYAMSIAMRYSNSFVMAEEITNDSFLKVFAKIDAHNTQKSFKAWLRRIVVNTALDCNRREIKNQNIIFTDEIVEDYYEDGFTESSDATEIIAALQTLSPAYRVVFNLYVMEGYSHEEIALRLNIGITTSRSNLARAKKKIKEIIQISKTYA